MSRTRKWIALTVALVVLLIAGGWYLLVSPKNSATAALLTQTASANTTSGTLQAQLASLRKQQQGLSEQERLLKEFNTRMPPVVDLPELIRTIAGAARASKADLVALAPGIVTQPSAAAGVAPPGTVAQAPAATPASTPTPTPAVTGATVAGGSSVRGPGTNAAYSIVPLSITISGSYFAIESFLTAVEALPRALVVSSLTLTPAPNPASSASPAVNTTSPNLLVALTAAAYVAPSGASTPAVSVSPTAGVAGSLK